MYSRLGKHTRGRSTELKGRAHVYGCERRSRRQSRRRCNSQEGSEAERLSVEVAWRSNGRRETGGIKLLQTITFNEKVNATSRGLARTWMQMCRRRVISKQSSPPTYRLLLPPHLPHCRCLPFATTRRTERNEAAPGLCRSLFMWTHGGYPVDDTDGQRTSVLKTDVCRWCRNLENYQWTRRTTSIWGMHFYLATEEFSASRGKLKENTFHADWK